MVDLDKSIDMADVQANCRVALKNDSYKLHKILPNKVWGHACCIYMHTRGYIGGSFIGLLYIYMHVHAQVDPLVSLMMVEKVPDSTYDMIGGLDKQIKEIKEVLQASMIDHMLVM